MSLLTAGSRLRAPVYLLIMYLAIDIGGTKTLLAVFSAEGEVTESIKFETSQKYEEFLITLENTVAKMTTKIFSGCAIGCRGDIDRSGGILISGGSALAWDNVSLVSDVSAMVSCPISLENDSKLAGLSEAMLLKDEYKKVLYITISTGIGGALVVNGVIDVNTIDSEIGQMVYERSGKFQSWESFASGKAIVAKYGQRASEITDPEIWHAITKDIAMGLYNICLILTPDVVVIGGGAGANLPKFETPLQDWLKELSREGHDRIPPVVVARRPEEAVIYGCYEFALQHRA